MKKIIDAIKADPRYQRNIEYGEPRPGHPEGKVKFHIADLEANLEILGEWVLFIVKRMNIISTHPI